VACPEVDVDIVNVAVMAPILGADLSYVTDVDGRVRALDANEVIRDGRPGEVVTPDRVNDILAVADVLLVGYPVAEGLAGRAPRLSWAHHTQAGVSNLLGSDLWTSSVTLTTSRGVVGATAIAEYVMAAASHFARGLQEGTRQKRDRVFTTDGYELLSLRGATMGILGLGGIGREVARLSRAVGMRVIATRRSAGVPAPDTDGADLVFPADRILQVAAESDFLAVCSQLTPETRGLVGDQVFAAMKPGAVLINIARGEEVDEDALITAVTAGRIRGAVLDVYDGELGGRPPRAELLDLPQILLTPHIATRGDPGLAEPVRRLFAENLRRFLDDRPLLNVVDRDRGY
jgi:D-2-hydroxyacid dehydrogenase (NADP+)